MADITPSATEFGLVRQDKAYTLPGAAQLAVGDIVYMNTSGQWAKADADALELDDICGVVVSRQANAYTAITQGLVSLGIAPLTSKTIGDRLWCSTTAGKLADAAPTASGATVRVLGRVFPYWGASGDKLVAFDGVPGSAATVAAIAPLALTYGSNDPAYTPDGSLAVTDGAAPTVVELVKITEELIATDTAIIAALVAHGIIEAA